LTRRFKLARERKVAGAAGVIGGGQAGAIPVARVGAGCEHETRHAAIATVCGQHQGGAACGVGGIGGGARGQRLPYGIDFTRGGSG
jgi:hypothetical protein